MPDDGSHLVLLRAMDLARPDTAVTVLRHHLTRHLGATHVRVLLANYQLTALRTILSPDEREPLNDTAAGQAFTAQEPVQLSTDAGETQIYLPLSVHGDRVGVLQVALPGPVRTETLEQLADLATVAAYVLAASSRHTDLLHRAARSRRLSLAAELQWQLLPARGCLASEYEIAGHLEPAYDVYADNFDWSENGDDLLVSITDAAHHARSTPLLTTLAVTACRNARRAGLDIAEQAALADQAVYAHHQGEHSVGTILMSIDITTGLATAVKAGSPQVVLWRDGALQPVPLTDQTPLGMFERTDYAAQSFALATGDRLLFMSDGVLRGLATRGRPFPQQRLRELLDQRINPHPSAVVRAIIDELIELRDGDELDDDATVVCLDWNGPGRSNELALTESALAVDETRHLHALRSPSSMPNPCGPSQEETSAATPESADDPPSGAAEKLAAYPSRGRRRC